MIDFDNIRAAVVSGLRNALDIPVIRSNTTTPLPKLPFCSYTFTSLLDNSKGTWARYNDSFDRLPAHQTVSVTVNSEDYSECAGLALKAHDYFSRSGVETLKDSGIVVESVGNITPRDTVISVEYEYRQGFDIRLGIMNALAYSRDDGVQSVMIAGREIQNGGD